MNNLGAYYEVSNSEWYFPAGYRANRNTRSESLRQWALKEITNKLFINRLIENGRVEFFDSGVAEERGDAGGSIFGFRLVTPGGSPFILVSLCDEGFAEEAYKNLYSSLLGSETSAIGISSDGTVNGTFFLRRKFDEDKCEKIRYVQPFIEPFFANGGDKSICLRPMEENVENIFFELHSHIRDIDGLHADEALDELCKFIYVKIYDEEGYDLGKGVSLHRGLYGHVEEFAANIREKYIEANEYDVRVFRLKIPNYERSRGVFSSGIRLSNPALAKVAESLQEYNLSASSIDIKGRAFQKVFLPTIRSGMGQYFTPDPIVKLIVSALKPKVDDLIIDPFCGSGHFLSSALDYVLSNNGGASDKALHEFSFGKLHGIEKSDRMVRVAMTDMRLHGDGHSNIRCTDALLDFANYPDLEPESFDIILTNPPFGSLLGHEAFSQLGTFELSQSKARLPLEVLGIERCFQFLRPGGKMAIVLPDSILTNKNLSYVRDWIKEKLEVMAVVSLPVETFTPFGANIKTSILFMRKPKVGEVGHGDKKIIMLKVENIGYDAAGRKKSDNDIQEACSALSKHLSEVA